MASLTEFPEETRRRVDEIGSADLVLGVAGAVHPDQLRARAGDWIQSLAPAPFKAVVLYAGLDDLVAIPPAAGVEFVAYPSPPHDPSFGPWAEISTAQRAVLSLALLFEARACAALHRDLAVLSDAVFEPLVSPVLNAKSDLVSPIYPETKYEGLINKSILIPLSR